VLGIDREASRQQIRDAYRNRARTAHPDRSGSADEMALVNEAYRVLSDPGRRAQYDRSLGTGSARPSAETWTTRTVPDPTPHLPPARVPWRFMIVMGLIGIALVIAGAALRDDPAPAVPDGVLRPGSCVEISPEGLAFEVACAPGERIEVIAVVNFDAQCPTGTARYLDRRGLGAACVREVSG
jgi:hypothetical protein